MKKTVQISLLALMFIACADTPVTTAEGVEQTLDALHRYASEADGENYFSLFTDDAVFLGTDATERWPIAEFREYAMGRFSTGVGWTYESTERFIYFDDDGNTAWFDERVVNEKYGEFRGTGVLEKRGGKWLISHYNLTAPIPNDLLVSVVEIIREYEKGE